jgi:hypothetical protein
MGVASRLFQATQGYVTNPSMSIGGQPPPNLFDPATLFKLLQQLIDQEIQAFLQGLISAAQLEARLAQLVFVTATQLEQRLGQFIGQVDQEINRIVPGLIPVITITGLDALNAAIGTLNAALSVLNLPKLPTIGSTTTTPTSQQGGIPDPPPSPYGDIAGPFPTIAALNAANTGWRSFSLVGPTVKGNYYAVNITYRGN